MYGVKHISSAKMWSKASIYDLVARLPPSRTIDHAHNKYSEYSSAHSHLAIPGK